MSKLLYILIKPAYANIIKLMKILVDITTSLHRVAPPF